MIYISRLTIFRNQKVYKVLNSLMLTRVSADTKLTDKQVAGRETTDLLSTMVIIVNFFGYRNSQTEVACFP